MSNVSQKPLIPALGGWEIKNDNTIYQAATDGFVLAVGLASPSTPLQIMTDSANPPTTLRQEDDDTGAGVHGCGCSPVRKGDYWKTVNTNHYLFWLSYIMV